MQPESIDLTNCDRERLLLRDVLDHRPVYLFTSGVRSAAGPLAAIAHRSGGRIFVEFEPVEDDRAHSVPELYRLVQHSIARMQQSGSVADLCRNCAAQVQQISGFDRVKAYRFDGEWTGR